MDMLMFKIRHKDSGLFSKGGSDAKNIWTKGGKTWTNIGHVKSHLNTFISGDDISGDYPYMNAEIVKVFISYEDCFKSDVNQLVVSIIENKAKANTALLEQEEIWQKNKRRLLFEELQKEFG